MKQTYTLAFILCSALLASTAGAVPPAASRVKSVPADRIVGLWSSEGETRPCGSTLPFVPTRNSILFQAGGTVITSPQFPPGGVPNVYGVLGINQRSQDMGTWSYDPLTREYTIKLRFDWYVDGQYHGYQTLDRTLALNTQGDAGIGTVHSTRYTAEGNVIIEVCGDAISERL